MESSPGKKINCTRTLEVIMVEGYDDLTYEVPASFQSMILGPDGFLRSLDSDGDLHIINPAFVVRMMVHAEIKTDMDVASKDES